MPLSTDVNLPREHVVRFPQRCVRCNADNEGRLIRLWTHTIGWWTWVFWMFGRPFSVRVPACSPCSRVIRCQRLGGLAITIGVTIVFLYFGWPWLDDFVARPIRKWVAMLAVILCLMPCFLWELFLPPAIDITAYSDNVDYEFRDPDYALEFAILNRDAEWVKVDDTPDIGD